MVYWPELPVPADNMRTSLTAPVVPGRSASGSGEEPSTKAHRSYLIARAKNGW
jgi:hypothetical protein